MMELPKSQKIILLQQDEQKKNKLLSILEMLKKPNLKIMNELLENITSADEQWLKSFFEKDGWNILVKSIEKKEGAKSGKDITILQGLIEIFKFLLNDESTTKRLKDFQLILMIVRIWDTRDVQIKKDIFDILEFILDQNGCYE